MFSTTKVVNKYHEDFDILIQRGTKWGNPFKEGTRDEIINSFEEYFLNMIKNGKITKNELKELYGKKLGCSCKQPNKEVRCHGDFIAKCVEVMFSDMYDQDTKNKFFGMEIK